MERFNICQVEMSRILNEIDRAQTQMQELNNQMKANVKKVNELKTQYAKFEKEYNTCISDVHNLF